MLTNFRKTLVFSEKILYWSFFWDVVVQLPRYVRLFATPWTEVPQASLSFIISWSLLRLMSVESMMPSNNFTLCHPLLLPSVFPSIKVFSSESALCIRWPKYWRLRISVLVCVCVSLSGVWLFATPWTVAHQAPLSMEFSRQEYSSGLLLLSPGDLPNPGIKPGFPTLQQILYHLSHQGSLNISPSNEQSRLISFSIDWFGLLAIQGNLKSLLQHHSSKTSILQCAAFFMVQLSHQYISQSFVSNSLLDHWKRKRVPEKHLFLLYWLCQSLWLCGSQ